jgi:hypothetical protein
MGGPVVQNPAVQNALIPIKLYVRAVERNLSSQFPHPMTKNYCVWSASKNRDIISAVQIRPYFHVYLLKLLAFLASFAGF